MSKLVVYLLKTIYLLYSGLMFRIIILPAFKDNYIFMLCDEKKKKAVVVDPGDSSVVFSFLEKENYRLSSILITHHHSDHTGGILELKKETKAVVYGPKKEFIPGIDVFLSNQRIVILGEPVHVFDTPGHTLGHICYYFPKKKILFSGDTLFSFGCGRLFEGSSKQMWESLKKLRNLPEETLIYCAHEYTLNNLAFACSLEPENKKLQSYYKQLQTEGFPLIPSTIDKEKAFNPFFRCDSDSFIKHIEKRRNKPFLKNKDLHTFSYLRSLKDNF